MKLSDDERLGPNQLGLKINQVNLHRKGSNFVTCAIALMSSTKRGWIAKDAAYREQDI